MDYNFKIPIRSYPDQEGVAREYRILSNLACSNCKHPTLQITSQHAVTAEEQSGHAFPVAGDHMVCQCTNCNHEVEIMFEFVPAATGGAE